MPLEFDAVSKYLLDSGPREWLELSGCKTTAKITPMTSDLSTVSANADKLYNVQESSPWLVNFEPFSSRDDSGPARICLYSTLALAKLELPVHTVVILLSRRADMPAWSGVFQARIPGASETYLKFHYNVLRVWEIPPEVLLEGGIGTLALAPISKIAKSKLPELMRRVMARVETEIPREKQRNFVAAMYSLMGLCYEAEFISKLVEGFDDMRESSVVQLWLNEGRAEGEAKGRVEGERDALLTLLKARFGKISVAVTRRLAKITDIEHLNNLVHFAAIDPDLETFVDRIPKTPAKQ